MGTWLWFTEAVSAGYRGTLLPFTSVTDLKGPDSREMTLRVDERLDEARGLGGRLRVEVVRARVAAEVKVEGTILLKQNKDILDLLSKKPKLLSMREHGGVFDANHALGDRGA